MKRVFLTLFFLQMMLRVLSSYYNHEYIGSQCKNSPALFFNLKDHKKSTAMIITPRKGLGYSDESDCNITISASNIRKGHVILYVKKIDFDKPGSCNNYLEIFDGNKVLKKLCGNFDRERDGQFFTLPKSDIMKFHYHTSDSSILHSGFEIIATAYTDGPCKGNFDFRCSNYYCISDYLRCDDINNCGDNSDETKDHPARCRLSAGAVTGIVISVLLLIALVSGVIWCFQRKRRVIKTVYQTPAPVQSSNMQQGYQQSIGQIQNPTYDVPPSYYSKPKY